MTGPEKQQGSSPHNDPRHPGSVKEEPDAADQPQKKRRLNRPITSCVTCRRLKTRCEIVAGRKACQRCISLRLDCDLPAPVDTDELSVATAASDSGLQLRMSHIEQSLERLTALVQTVVDNGALRTTPGVSPSNTVPQRLHHRPSSEFSVPLRTNPEPSKGVTRPVLLLRNLQTQFFGPKRDFSDEQLSVGSVVAAGIISPSLAQSLLRVFIKHYGSWVSVYKLEDMPSDMEQRHPLLFSSACLLATRHVPRITKATVHEMYLRVRRLVASVVFKTPPLDYEALQALAVLSMFTPTIQTAMPIDSWMVSGIAMNHGTLSFGLSGSDFNVSQETQAQLRRLRIWNALCLTNVQFSIGNGRPNMVQPKFIEQCARIIEFDDALLTDGKLYAEVLLYTRTESILSGGANIQLQHPGLFVVPELEDFRVRWGHLFDIPEGLSLKVGYWYCHLLVYRAALKGETADADSPGLVNEAIKTSCNMLELFLSLEFSIILDMPDHFFFMIIYAALTLCKFAFGHRLIAATQQSLMDLASNDEHIAYRFGIVLVEIRRKAAVAGIEDPNTNGGPQPSPGISDAVPSVAQLFSGNGDFTWDAFLAFNSMPDLSLGQGGLEEPLPYETSGYQPTFNPGE